MTSMQVLHVIAGFIVLAEALNKLERTSPFAKGLTPRQRLVDGLKAFAWMLLALGAGGALVGPLLQPMGVVETGMPYLYSHIAKTDPSLADVCALGGFAVLIVRTRIKEG
ncbi:MAG: hypothetical protein V4706_01680 [Pseudomonadota bacterium]